MIKMKVAGTVSSVRNIRHDTAGGYLGSERHQPFWKILRLHRLKGLWAGFLSAVAGRCGIPPLTVKKRFKLWVLWLVDVGFHPLTLKKRIVSGRMGLRTHDLRHCVSAARHRPKFVNIIMQCMTYIYDVYLCILY